MKDPKLAKLMTEKIYQEQELICVTKNLIDDIILKIIELMKKQGITKAELSKKLGKHECHMSKLLSGNKNFTIKTVTEVFHALGYSPHLTLSRLKTWECQT